MNRLTKKQVALLEVCKSRGFLIWRGRRLAAFHNAYYDWCMNSKKPFVCMYLNGKFGSIGLELPSCNRVDLLGKTELRNFTEKWGLFITEYNILPTDIPKVPVASIEAMGIEIRGIMSAVLSRREAQK